MPDVDIRNEDSRNLDVEDGSINLIVTSPPYNVGKGYDEYEDSLSQAEYEDLLKDVFNACYTALADDGRIAVNVAPVVNRPLIDLAGVVASVLQEIGYEERGHYIWHKGSSESSSAWGSWRSSSNPYEIFVHEHILVFSKNSHGRHETNGKTLTKEEFMEYIKSVWEIKPASGTDHPAPFPVEIPERLIKMHSYEGDTVLDPFMGSGTTGVAAVQHDREFIGYDVSEQYCDIAQERIDNV